MRKIISLILCAFVSCMVLSGCNNTTTEKSSIIREARFLTEKNQENQILIELPNARNQNNEETIVFIKDFIQSELEQLSGEKIELCYAREESKDLASEYSNYYINIKSNITFSSENLVSVVFEGMLNQKQSAHPTHLFFTLNYNPKTLETIPISDKYTLEEPFYELVIQKVEDEIKGQCGVNWKTVYDTVLEQGLEKQAFFEGMKDEKGYYAYYTETALGISIPVSFTLGNHIEVEIPYNVFEQIEIIDSGKHYRIYKGELTQVYYNIYDIKGKVVLSAETDRPLEINMLNDNIVDIEIGIGTGLTVHKYYGVEQDLFSQDFWYVLSSQNELVAYIDVPKEKPFENRKTIVQNIFDKNLFYKEFQLDFSNVDTPVIETKFSKDGESLQLTYLSGEEQTQISTTLDLIQ